MGQRWAKWASGGPNGPAVGQTGQWWAKWASGWLRLQVARRNVAVGGSATTRGFLQAFLEASRTHRERGGPGTPGQLVRVIEGAACPVSWVAVGVQLGLSWGTVTRVAGAIVYRMSGGEHQGEAGGEPHKHWLAAEYGGDNGG